MNVDRLLSRHARLGGSQLYVTRMLETQPDGSGKLVGYFIAEHNQIVQLHDLMELLEFVKPYYDRLTEQEIDAINQETVRRQREYRQQSWADYSSKSSSNSGYVYLLKAGPYYKIGVSTNVDKRIEQLSTLPPFDIELVHTIYSVDMYALEQDFHNLYADKRKNGEWFELTDSDVEFIKGFKDNDH